jgi:hypothetical protein
LVSKIENRSNLIAAPGVGKSRFVMEIIPQIKKILANKQRTEGEEKLFKKLQNVVSVFVTLANGMGPKEVDYEQPRQALLYRILYAYFIVDLNYSKVSILTD